jgi:hypothetical protein
VLLWFVGGSALIVWNVFRDPAIDYRVLALGSMLPDVLDVATGHRMAHSITVSIAVLVALMFGTIGRRPLRKRLLTLPIGMLLHLALDGVFQSTRTFWWPVTGLVPVAGHIPSFERSLVLNLAFEVTGALILRWFWKRFHLGDSEPRATLLATGRLPIP